MGNEWKGDGGFVAGTKGACRFAGCAPALKLQEL